MAIYELLTAHHFSKWMQV